MTLTALAGAAACGAGQKPAPAAAVSAGAGPSVASIAGYQAELASSEKRTEILVLATPHLSSFYKCLDDRALATVVARLAAWRPDLIAVEALPGETIEALPSRTDMFSELVRDGFAQQPLDAAPLAATALGVTADAARKELRAGPVPDGVRAVLLHVASYDYPSAVLRWTSLDAAARGRVPAELGNQLEESSKEADEIYRIAAPLAKQLGQTRLALVDDFAGEEPYTRRFDEFTAERKASAAIKEASSKAPSQSSPIELKEACTDPVKMTALYDLLNSPTYSREDVTAQWGVWFRTHFKSGLDRARLAGWEARNLGIATNIRKESSLFPGKRVLVIYGAAHKPFLDAYLAPMLDVRVVQWSEVGH